MRYRSSIYSMARCLPLFACLLVGSAALADNGAGGGYKVMENEFNGIKAPPAGPLSDGSPSAPEEKTASQRQARFEFLSGKITWRPNDNAVWANAKQNQPLRQGAQVWVAEGARAEVRFDDGSLLRLGSGAVVVLKTLYSDDQGEFTQINMVSGLVTMLPKQPSSLFEVDTRMLSVKATGPARIRVGVSNITEVGVRRGQATVEGGSRKTTLRAGEYLALEDGASPFTHQPLPAEDSWERWNDARDRALYAGRYPGRAYGPAYGPAVGVFLGFPIGGHGRHWHRW